MAILRHQHASIPSAHYKKFFAFNFLERFPARITFRGITSSQSPHKNDNIANGHTHYDLECAAPIPVAASILRFLYFLRRCISELDFSFVFRNKLALKTGGKTSQVFGIEGEALLLSE